MKNTKILIGIFLTIILLSICRRRDHIYMEGLDVAQDTEQCSGEEYYCKLITNKAQCDAFSACTGGGPSESSTDNNDCTPQRGPDDPYYCKLITDKIQCVSADGCSWGGPSSYPPVVPSDTTDAGGGAGGSAAAAAADASTAAAADASTAAAEDAEDIPPGPAPEPPAPAPPGPEPPAPAPPGPEAPEPPAPEPAAPAPPAPEPPAPAPPGPAPPAPAPPEPTPTPDPSPKQPPATSDGVCKAWAHSGNYEHDPSDWGELQPIGGGGAGMDLIIRGHQLQQLVVG